MLAQAPADHEETMVVSYQLNRYIKRGRIFNFL